MDGPTPDEIRAKVNLVEYVKSCGVALAPACGGREYAGRCPFHEDESASFFVNPAKGLFHCFGCGAGGNLFSFIMRRQGVNFRQAVVIAMNRFGGPPPRADSAIERLAGYYHFCFVRFPRGREYLAGRGIRSEAVIKKFHIGLAPGGDRAARALLDQGFDLETLRRAHIVNRYGKDAFFGRITVPLRRAGRVINIYGRSLSARYPHMYLPGARGELFNPEGVAPGETLIVCESILDCLTLVEHGFERSAAAFSANVTEESIHAIAAARPGAVVIAFDGDDAGRRGAESLAHRLNEKGIESRVIAMPDGADVNALFLDDPGGAARLFKEHAR